LFKNGISFLSIILSVGKNSFEGGSGMKNLFVVVLVVFCAVFLTSAKADLSGFVNSWSGATSSINNLDSDFFFGSDLAVDFTYNAENFGFLADLWGNSVGSKVFGDSNAVDFSAYGWVRVSPTTKFYLGTLPSYRYDADLLLDSGKDLTLYWLPGAEVEFTGSVNASLLYSEWSGPFGTPCAVLLLHAHKRADKVKVVLNYYSVAPHNSGLETFAGLEGELTYLQGEFSPYFGFASTNGKSGFAGSVKEKYAYRFGFNYKKLLNFEYAYIGAGADVGTSAYSNLFSAVRLFGGLGGAIKGYSLVRGSYEVSCSEDFKIKFELHFITADKSAGYVGDDSLFGARVMLHYDFS